MDYLGLGFSRRSQLKMLCQYGCSDTRISIICELCAMQASSSHKGDVDKILGFDFANWLASAVTYRDFVDVKMDVEGTVFHLIPRLIETRVFCLIDQLFLVCHYYRWHRCCPGQRSAKYTRTYSECLDLFTKLGSNGVLAASMVVKTHKKLAFFPPFFFFCLSNIFGIVIDTSFYCCPQCMVGFYAIKSILSRIPFGPL